MKKKNITILGIGNVLFSDEGFGIRIIELLEKQYEFSNNVSLIDGGVLGLKLMSIISEADILIVIDAIQNGGKPGDIYKIKGEQIPSRIRTKNSLHQIDFLESLSLCKALNKMPKTLIIGIEPKDIKTLNPELSKLIFNKINIFVKQLLLELNKIKITYKKKKEFKNINAIWNNK